MKNRIILSLLLVLGITVLSKAQEADTLMRGILENNLQLKAARETFQVALLEAGTGNTPPDPEVEFAYLFGKPTDLGNRMDFSVTQQLDFPTVYAHRSNIRKIRNSRAELDYLLVRQEVLNRARQLWIEQVHLNQLRILLMERLNRANSIRSHVQQMRDVGEVGSLEYSQAQLLVASVEGEYEEVLARLHNNQLALKEMAGGEELEILDIYFPASSSIVADTLLASYKNGPGAQLYQFVREQKEAEKSLAVSQHLPKISAGYYSETVSTDAFRGIKLGISLPLWEKARTVKMARTEIVQADAELNRFLSQQEKEIRQKLKDLEMLRTRVEKLEEALASANSLDLLASSMENGEISLSEYFYTSDFYFRNQQLLLRYKRDQLALEADLLKIYL